MPETLQKLVQVTSEHIGSPERPSPTSPFAKLKDRWLNRASRSIEPPRVDEVQSDSTPADELSSVSQTDVALARAQRVDMPTKIKASIRLTDLILKKLFNLPSNPSELGKRVSYSYSNYSRWFVYIHAFLCRILESDNIWRRFLQPKNDHLRKRHPHRHY